MKFICAKESIIDIWSQILRHIKKLCSKYTLTLQVHTSVITLKWNQYYSGISNIKVKQITESEVEVEKFRNKEK